MREAKKGETGVVVKGRWVFTGDSVQCTWKSINVLKDPDEHINIGTIVETAFARHPKTGKIESGFVLVDAVSGAREGYAESMITHIGFLNGVQGQVETREFPRVLGQKHIVIPDNRERRGA